jgi:hypothetical protein
MELSLAYDWFSSLPTLGSQRLQRTEKRTKPHFFHISIINSLWVFYGMY